MSEKEKIRLQALLPNENNISIVPHPIYDMFKPTSLSKGEIRRKLQLPLEKPVMLFFGFIRPYKGLNILLDALEIMRNGDALGFLNTEKKVMDAIDSLTNGKIDWGIKNLYNEVGRVF